MLRTGARTHGFALPTIVIASVVMFMILVSAVGAVASSRVALDTQYYQAQLRDAAESGAARASDCIANSTMTLNVVVTPATDCAGATVAGRNLYILTQPTFRTSYEVKLTSQTSQSKKVQILGKIDTLRASNGSVVKTSTLPLNQNAAMVIDPAGDRPSQRWWYFGDRVILDFGTSGNAMPIAKYNSSSATTEPLANEGATVVTDQNGNLVFWSNGLTIWDKSGNVMQNSTGLNGGASATQAVASFPLNTARTKYAVISNSGQGETGPGELYLSIVDMSLNGGLGGVTAVKNQKLGSGVDYSLEAVGAMPNEDGTGYFVYTYNTVAGQITSFLIKNNQTVSGPFTTTLSPAPEVCYVSPTGFPGYGTFNFSRDYSKMVVMVGSWRCPSADSGTVYLFDTNTKTGALTLDASWINEGLGGDSSHTHGGYSADFSPDEKYIYTTQIYPSTITRYNIQNPTSTAIKASEWIIGYATSQTDATWRQQSGGQVRQGPDGRMYISDLASYYWPITYQGSVSSTTPCKLSYIDAPDSPTQTAAGIGLKLDAITLPAGACGVWGLPQMATVFKPKVYMY